MNRHVWKKKKKREDNGERRRRCVLWWPTAKLEGNTLEKLHDTEGKEKRRLRKISVGLSQEGMQVLSNSIIKRWDRRKGRRQRLKET